MIVVAGCSKKEDGIEIVPPGFCKGRSRVPVGGRLGKLRIKTNRTKNSLPKEAMNNTCHAGSSQSQPNGYWNETKDAAGCPATASQQDPHPELGKAKKSLR